MKDAFSWQYDEYRQVGTDYADIAQVEAYDARHAQFRDVHAECQAILDALELTPRSVLIELGTGTGAFAIHAAPHCETIYAVDVSAVMLEYARRKADQAGARNITFCRGGFLTYEHDGAPADAVVTCMAFHHLPDFWKGVALGRMHRMLRPGGRLYLHDVIFEEGDVTANITRWIDELGKVGGAQLRDEIALHIKDEYSTYDWVMDGLLKRAGFSVRSRTMVGGVIGTYICVKD